jgi:hypothetical protein
LLDSDMRGMIGRDSRFYKEEQKVVVCKTGIGAL